MARTPVHPGEHLAEQLRELGLSASEPWRQLGVPTNRITIDRRRTARGHRRHRAPARALLRHEHGILAEPPGALRFDLCRLPHLELNAHPGMTQHVDQRIQADLVDLAAQHVVEARL